MKPYLRDVVEAIEELIDAKRQTDLTRIGMAAEKVRLRLADHLMDISWVEDHLA